MDNNLFEIHNPNYNSNNLKTPTKKKRFAKWFTKRKIIFYIIALVIIGFVIIRVRSQNNNGNILTDVVKRQDLKQTVLATGQVTSQTDLSLSFKTSGIVNNVNVKVGNQVKKGQALANLDQRDQVARLTQARGAFQQAHASYKKVLEGASSEEVTVAQVTLDNAKISLANTKKQQQVLVDNAYKAMLNSSPAAVGGSGNTGIVTVTVSGTYSDTQTGVYKIGIYSSGSGLRYQVSGLESGDGPVDSSLQPLGSRGLYIQFSSTSVPTNNVWTVTIPNTQASTYITNLNAYQSALETQRSAVSAAESVVTAAQAALDFKKAKARPVDVEASQALVTSALGQLQAAEADYENTFLRAPTEGTITKIDIKEGELATALKEVIVLQDVKNLHIEANISEANIAYIKNTQTVEISFDSLGPDRKFKGTVTQVDPASTVISGVVNYKVTVGIEKLEEIKPGMTANISILTATKEKVLAVPSRAVISKDSKKFVRLVTDSKNKTYNEIEVTTGLEADEGLVEVLSGINEGQEIITFIKSK